MSRLSAHVCIAIPLPISEISPSETARHKAILRRCLEIQALLGSSCIVYRPDRSLRPSDTPEKPCTPEDSNQTATIQICSCNVDSKMVHTHDCSLFFCISPFRQSVLIRVIITCSNLLVNP